MITYAGQDCAEGWRNVVSPFEGKTKLFQKKVTKKGPKTGSGGMLLLGTICYFFRHFQGFPKIQVEMTGAGKVSVDGAYATRKNHYDLSQMCKHTRAV